MNGITCSNLEVTWTNNCQLKNITCVALICEKNHHLNYKIHSFIPNSACLWNKYGIFLLRKENKICSDLNNQTFYLILQSSALSHSEIDIHHQYWGCGWAHDDHHVEYSLKDANFFLRRTLKPSSEYVWTFGPVLFPVFTFKQPVLFTRALVGSIAEPSKIRK